MEDESKSHLYLALGIIGIILFSICIALLIVLCERWRRRRKFRPGIRNQYPVPMPMTLSPLKGPPPSKKRGDEWNNLVFANRGLLISSNSSEKSAMLEKRPLSMPNLVDAVEDEDEKYLSIQIAAILGSFPNLKYMEDSEDDADQGLPSEDKGGSGHFQIEVNLHDPGSPGESRDELLGHLGDPRGDGTADDTNEDDEGPETEVDDEDQVTLELIPKGSNKNWDEACLDCLSHNDPFILLETTL